MLCGATHSSEFESFEEWHQMDSRPLVVIMLCSIRCGKTLHQQRHHVVLVYTALVSGYSLASGLIIELMITHRSPNQSPEPTARLALASFAVAVHAASRRWLSFFSLSGFTLYENMQRIAGVQNPDEAASCQACSTTTFVSSSPEAIGGHIISPAEGRFWERMTFRAVCLS